MYMLTYESIANRCVRIDNDRSWRRRDAPRGRWSDRRFGCSRCNRGGSALSYMKG